VSEVKNNNNNNNNNNNVKQTKVESAEKRNREFILNENVSASTVKDIIMGIIEINRLDAEAKAEAESYEAKPIKVIVNTYGGSVYDGFALTAVIDTSETPVYTYLYGKAMSMGFIIFASGHKRFAHPLATLMYHQVANTLHGKTNEIEEGTTQMRKLQKTYDDYILTVSNVPKTKMDSTKRKKTEWYIPASEAIEYGLVDELLTSTRNKNQK
jgi:ATP-dependent Clp protease, protease subunit